MVRHSEAAIVFILVVVPMPRVLCFSQLFVSNISLTSDHGRNIQASAIVNRHRLDDTYNWAEI